MNPNATSVADSVETVDGRLSTVDHAEFAGKATEFQD
jgi:hypothetical protein